MKKSCCIDDGNITPKHSSCSMILRSDCIHGPAHKSQENQQEKTHQNRNFLQRFTRGTSSKLASSENRSQISYLHSSLKHIAYTSAKTYSILKGSFFSHLDKSSSQDSTLLNRDELLEGHVNQKLFSLSTSGDAFLNNNSISSEEYTFNNKNCVATNYSEIMSQSRDFSRSSYAANALSDSETEEQDKVRKRRSKKYFNLRPSVGRTESLESNNHSNHISTVNDIVTHRGGSAIETSLHRMHTSEINNCIQTPSSSTVYTRPVFSHSSGSDTSFPTSTFSPSTNDISIIQCSLIGKLRRYLWTNIYLIMIKCVNWDVWLLSRLQKYKAFVVLLLLLPFLVYLLCGLVINESKSKTSDGISSNVIAFSSYMYSLIRFPFKHNKDITFESSKEETQCSKKFSEIVSISLKFLSNLFLKPSETISANNQPTHTTLNSKSIANKEHIKSVTDEALEEKLKNIIKIQESQSKDFKQMQSDIKNLHLEFQTLKGSVRKLGQDNAQQSNKSSIKYESLVKDHKTHIKTIHSNMENFEKKLMGLSETIKNCCDQKWTMSDFAEQFEKYLIHALKNLIDEDLDESSPYYFFNNWLHSKLASEKKLSQELKLEFEKMKTVNAKLDKTSESMIESVVKRHVESLKKDLTTLNKMEISLDSMNSLDLVKKLIKDAILLYDADKTGLVDYALESGGGSVLSTRCSESYAEKDGTISVLGFPLWSTHNSPRTAIQPDMQPGQCWAFKGSQGFLVIQLSYTIYPTGFTLEHIPVSLSPTGSIDSAPKNFSVWGLISEKDNEGKLLGTYIYKLEGNPLQYFPVQNIHNDPFSYVELKIHSNHGNLNYTCLYRFRVHGNQQKQ